MRRILLYFQTEIGHRCDFYIFISKYSNKNIISAEVHGPIVHDGVFKDCYIFIRETKIYEIIPKSLNLSEKTKANKIYSFLLKEKTN